MQFALALLGSLLPPALLLTAAWLWLFRRRRPGIFWTAFGFGVAATLGAGLLELPLLGFAMHALRATGPPLALLLGAVALIEEGLKCAAWYACFGIFRRPLKTDPGIAAGCGATAALAFAALENVLFNLGATMGLGHVFWPMVAARAVASVPLHATTGLIIGIVAWRIHGRRRRGLGNWVALIGLPFALHATFNIVQAVGGARERLLTEITPAHWIGIGVAALVVWGVAALAIRYYLRQRRATR